MARIRLAGSFKIIKLVLYMFTLLFLLFGIIVFSIGIKTRTSSSFINLSDNHTGANLLIFVGLFMIFSSVVGFLGAFRENKCLLGLYFGTLFFIFMLLMAAGLWAAAYKNKLKFKLREFMGEKIKEYDENRKYLDDLQNSLKCCGVDSASDYRTIAVPESCGETSNEKINRIGCIEALQNLLKNNFNRIALLGIIMGLIMILGMAFSMALCCAIREADKLMN